MKTHRLILILPFLLALGLVTAVMAAAQANMPGVQANVPGAQANVPDAASPSSPAGIAPVSMTLDGDPNTDWSQVEEFVRNDTKGWFSFTFSYLYPNWRWDINMNVLNPSPDPVPGGRFFTNHAEIMQVEGKPTYADNTTEYTLASGPDLYVEKSLVGGEIKPGELVIFSLLFGNPQSKQAWWWNLKGSAWLTDVLPAGTEYITATRAACGPSAMRMARVSAGSPERVEVPCALIYETCCAATAARWMAMAMQRSAPRAWANSSSSSSSNPPPSDMTNPSRCRSNGRQARVFVLQHVQLAGVGPDAAHPRADDGAHFAGVVGVNDQAGLGQHFLQGGYADLTETVRAAGFLGRHELKRR